MMQPQAKSAEELLTKLTAMRSNVDTGKIISNVSDPRLILQDFTPSGLSLEWEIGAMHWRTMGVRPFVRNEVPFLINNDGLLSALAAVLLFTNCRETALEDAPVNVIEFGAGSGLFARYFLDAFRELCQQQGADYYNRLTYFVTDASPQTVSDWVDRGLYAEHGMHAVPAVCNAEQIENFTSVDGQVIRLSNLRAVFCNYVLDVLPCALVRHNNDAIEELNIRTYLTADAALLAQHTPLTPTEIQALAQCTSPSDRQQLERLMVLFDYETKFMPVTRTIPYIKEAIAWGGDAERVVLNHGALTLLEKATALLDCNGFILINDYGATEKDQQAAHGVSQRFGATSAIGINFPMLEHFAESMKLHAHAPPGDSERSIHTRLITSRPLPATEEIFNARFSAESINAFDVPTQQARSSSANGNHSDALDHYREAIEQQPRNWRLLGEIAEFLLFEIKDASASLELAQRAVELNPNLSAWLWNILGDALWILERHADAHTAYVEAQRIDPEDPRTLLNLSYTLLQRADPDAALATIAKGLARDKNGSYRERLLTKQQHILATISAANGQEHERSLLRLSRLQTNPTKNNT